MVRRIEKLAVLPIFYRLEGRKIVIAGGSEAAAWKAELLAASGAQVHVFSKTLCNSFIEKITAKESCSAYVHHQRAWDAGALEGAALAICDAVDDEEAARFVAACRAMGVPCNVIDNPKYCDFQFGTIVNRSPVIVSISTNGATPILGQAIRRKIETLLPKSLGQWAQLGASLRAYVAEKLPFGAPRRHFWQFFSDAAFDEAPDHTAKSLMTNFIDKTSMRVSNDGPAIGKITVIEVSSNDAEMLTLKAARALQSADVILYDKTISNDILELARREARHILAKGDVKKKMNDLVQVGNYVVRILDQNTNFTGDGLDKSSHSTENETQIDFI